MTSGWHLIAADGGASSAARRFVIEWMTERGAGRRDIDDMALAASELTANVVQHGDAEQVRLRMVDSDPLCWTLEVAGGRHDLPAHLRDPSLWTISRPDRSSGRGLGIVRTVVDEVEVVDGHEGTTIRCHHRRTV